MIRRRTGDCEFTCGSEWCKDRNAVSAELCKEYALPFLYILYFCHRPACETRVLTGPDKKTSMVMLAGTAPWATTIAAAFGVLGALVSPSVASAESQVEEQHPIADPAAGAFDDSAWTSSPLYARAIALMKESPLIDTHIDLPQVIRSLGTHTHTYTQAGRERH